MKHLQSPLTQDRDKELTFDALYDEISDGWQDKAKKLQIRRNRAMKQAIRDGRY